MSFNQAGDVNCRVEDVVISDPKFPDTLPAIDVNIKFVSINDPSQSDWWRGEISQNYGKGNMATMTQAEITFKTLRKLGFAGDDLTELKTQLEGVEEMCHIKASEKDGKTYHNIQYVGASSYAPQAIDPNQVNARFASIMGTAAKAPAAPAPAAAPVTSNPFAKKGDTGKLPF